MESQPQNPEFGKNSEIFYPCMCYSTPVRAEQSKNRWFGNILHIAYRVAKRLNPGAATDLQSNKFHPVIVLNGTVVTLFCTKAICSKITRACGYIHSENIRKNMENNLNCFIAVPHVDWLQSLKQFFINVPYHLIEASLTLMALITEPSG